MVTPETIGILVNLLDDWQELLLRGEQRAMFLAWLGRHTKMDIHADTFKEKLAEWWIGINDPKELYADVLIIHSEILWSSKLEITK
jgi:hypothetical protein